MRAVTKAIALAGAGAALLLGAAPAASAATAQPSVAYVGPIVATPGGVATLKISYTCTSSPGSMSHLYVGLKQGSDVNASDHTSSNFAETFYSTNWKSDSGPNALTCDGAQHVQTMVLKPQPGFSGTSGTFSDGEALVQLCLFDNVTQFSESGEPADGGFAPSYTMEHVRAAGR